MKEKRGLIYNRSTMAWLSVLTGLVLQGTAIAESSPVLGTVNQPLVLDNTVLNATPEQPVTGFQKNSVSYDAAKDLYSYNPGGTAGRINLRYARTTLPNIAAVPVAQWALDGRSGVKDSAEGDREANDGMLEGGASIKWSSRGRVLALNGSTDYVRVTAAEEINTAIRNRTISLWFKPNKVTGRQVLYSEGTGENGCTIYLEGSALKAGAWSTESNWTNSFITLDKTISTGEWVHMALRLKNGQTDQGKLQGFFGGQFFGLAKGREVKNRNGDITLGARTDKSRFITNGLGVANSDGNRYAFDGSISDVRVYNVSLSGSDLKRLADASVEISQINAVISQDIMSAAVSDWDTILERGTNDIESISILYKDNSGAFGSLAAFGPNTRVLAVYQEEFALAQSAVAHGLDDDNINKKTLGERFGPFMTVSTLGNGRILTMATGDWFTSKATWGINDTGFVNNALGWLTGGMTSGDKKILVTSSTFFDKLTTISGTKGDHIPPIENIIQTSSAVTTMSDSAFVAELAGVDVFMGSLDELSSGQINALADFVLSGKALLIGSIGHPRIYDNSASPYANHPDTVYYSGNNDNIANIEGDNILHHKGDRVHLDNVNQLLRLAGTGVGCYPFLGNSDMLNKMFSRHIVTQWNSEYASIDKAVDALIDKGGPLVFKKKPGAANTELLAKANLFASQLITLTMALPLGDPLRNELDVQLDKLKAEEGSIIQDPVQMALLMHEAENNFRHVYHGSLDQIKPSTYAKSVDTTLHAKVIEETELKWERYRIQPLGLYAAPGDIVTLDFTKAPEMLKKGFSVRISQHRHSEFASIVAWNRPPILELAVPINSNTVSIASAYGGNLYIDYNTDSLPDLGNYYDKGSLKDEYGYVRLPTGFIKRHHKMSGAEQVVTVSGAYESATFFLGKDTVEDWNNRIKYLPSRMVNLVGNHSVITVDKSILLGRNDVIDPEWMLLAADRMGVEQARLAGMEHQFAFGYIYERERSWNQLYTRGYGMHVNLTHRADQAAGITLESITGTGQDYRRHEGDHQWGSQIARLLSSNGEIDAYMWELMVNRVSGRVSLDQLKNYQLTDEIVSENDHGIPELDTDGNVITNRFTVETEYPVFSTKASFAAAGALLTEAIQDGYADKFVYEILASSKETKNPKGDAHQAGRHNLVFWLTLANSQFGDQTGWDVMGKALSDRATSRWQSDMGSPDFDLPQWFDEKAAPKAEGFAVNWAAASGYDISKYMKDILGFTITGDATDAINAYTGGQKVWLPLGSEYINQVVQVQENSSGHVLDLVENTVALGLDRKIFNPKVQVASTNTEHGVITQTSNVWTYTPTSGYSGFDSFTYTASHGAGWGQPEETFTVNLFVAPTTEPLEVSLEDNIPTIIEKYGHGATVEEWSGMWLNSINSGAITKAQKEAEGLTRLKRSARIRNKLHSETMSIPADRVYKTLGGMASLYHRRDLGRPKRIRAYFKAPETASYRFYAENQLGDEGLLQVWLNSQNENPEGATKIISGAMTEEGLQRWSTNAVSAPIKLDAGKLYYIEAISGQVYGLSVGMTYDASGGRASIPVDLNAVVDVIPNKYLIPYIAPRSARAIDDVVTVAGGGTYMIDVVANDQYFTKGTNKTGTYLGEMINDLSKVKLVYASEAHHGTISIVDNQLRYTPDAGFSGTERISYLIQHTLYERAQKGVVTITTGAVGTPIAGPAQTAVNTAPVANPDQQIAASSQSVFINVLANDVDADGDKLTLLSVMDPDKGTVRIHLDGEKIEYTPEPGGIQGTKPVTFNYTITDSCGGTNTAKVTITRVNTAIFIGELPWLETFNRSDLGFQDLGDTAWVLDDSRVIADPQKGYGLEDRMLRISGTHTGDTSQFVEWRSGYIDISNYSGIAISVDAKSSGKMTSTKTAWLKLMYRLDDDMTLHTFDHIAGQINDQAEEFTTFSTNNIVGKRIQVVIQASSKWGKDIYHIDNIEVDGELRNVRPTANAGSNIPKIDRDGNGSVSVTLDGSKSEDSDGTIVSYVWKVDGVRVATGIKADYDAPVGSTTITLIVTDNDGARDTDRVVVTVEEPAIVDVLAGIVYAPDGVDVGGTNGLSVASSELINEQSITNMTWSLWFGAASLTNRQMLYEQGGGQRGANIYLDEKQVYMGIWGMEGDIDAYLMAGSVSTGSWNHAVLVLDGDTVNAYLNGAKTGPKIGSILGSHRNPIGIGHVNNKTSMHDDDKGFHGSHTFNGQIDELRIYNRSLTTNEVSRVFEFKPE